MENIEIEKLDIDWESIDGTEITQEEYDSLIYEPVYTDIKMNDEDSGRYPH